MFEIVEKEINVAILRERLNNQAAGALVVFEGMVRNIHEGRQVDRLEYQAFSEMAVKEGDKIMEQARDKFQIIDLCCQHRVGTLELGETAVWIGVLSGHREEGFHACKFIIDEIKKSVPIWKKEHFSDGISHWVKSS